MASVNLKQPLLVPADIVWGLIGQFNGVPDWHPAVEKCEIETKDGETIRHLALAGGGSIVERQTTHDGGARSYSYEILSPGPLPIANYKATITVHSKGSGCEVEWSSDFEAKGAAEGDAVAAVRGVYEAGFANLRKMFGAG
ncbi:MULTISPECIES: SRPBCC family protein [Limibacillus]|jgi:hypothetical protein|uniref:Polyketide cyclase / dehydrase and lipid transport n=1 Tax=Limibacillus halophilus TaxID=1579333 RepID=A0A839SWQ3_9PROT|nr:SRPBCC family protein [Limibacillus halophilus]MBB3066932.1 hypothetical protein [Limibacillus halophilus]